MEEKQIWYSQLLGYQRERAAEGRAVSDGYIAHCYRDKFDVWPQGLSKNMCSPGIDVRNFIKHKNIKFSKKKAQA
jgi:DNA repair protein RadD